jgi:hypothetical protein
MIVFRRKSEDEDLLVFATLSNHPFQDGYWIYNADLPDVEWQEVFNSASYLYGGDNTGNRGAKLPSRGGYIGPWTPSISGQSLCAVTLGIILRVFLAGTLFRSGKSACWPDASSRRRWKPTSKTWRSPNV